MISYYPDKLELITKSTINLWLIYWMGLCFTCPLQPPWAGVEPSWSWATFGLSCRACSSLCRGWNACCCDRRNRCPAKSEKKNENWKKRKMGEKWELTSYMSPEWRFETYPCPELFLHLISCNFFYQSSRFLRNLFNSPFNSA